MAPISVNKSPYSPAKELQRTLPSIFVLDATVGPGTRTHSTCLKRINVIGKSKWKPTIDYSALLVDLNKVVASYKKRNQWKAVKKRFLLIACC